MNPVVRLTVLVLFLWLMLTGICLGKQVYLSDGSILDAQSAWKRGDKVFVKINHEIVADFNASEIDLQRTFPKVHKVVKRSHHARRTVKKGTLIAKKRLPKSVKVATAAVPAPHPAVPRESVVKPVPPPAAPSATVSAPAAPAPAPQAAAAPASAEPALPPDKAELERRKQEAVKMMTEAILKKDPELMKKAVEMQKSAMPQSGADSRKNFGLPLYVPLIALLICLLLIVAHWVIFARAGQAGWKSLIPFYNMYILMEIAGKPGWWMFLLFVPLINLAIYFFAMLALARKFGRSELFGVGIGIFPMIFLPVLAFGDSRYEG